MDNKPEKRFVVTNPARDFPLEPSDKVIYFLTLDIKEI